jgi:NodT family efflux transporter outer membrane factor (OMF) lipoprotein
MFGFSPQRGLLALAVVTLVGCASSGEGIVASKQMSPQQVGLDGAASTSLVVEKWWLALGDDQLNHLVEQALKDQPNMAAVRARLVRMQAVADATRSSSLPQVGASVDPSRQLFTAKSIYPPPYGGHTYNMAEATVGMNWSVDLFGLHAAEWAAAKGQMQASRADVAAASVSLSAQVVKTYIALARMTSLRDVAAQTLEQQNTLRELTRARTQAGLDSQIDQRQTDGQTFDARVQLEAMDEQLNLLRHQLATLCGMAPETLNQISPHLDALKMESVPVRLGADLLGRRADVVAARWRVEAALQEIKVAEKQFYPDVNLGAFVGYNAIGFDQVFSSSSKEAGIMPAIHLPLFTAGMLRAQLRGREGDAEMAIANYNSVVLESVRQASDAISSAQSLQKQLADQDHSVAAARQSYDLSVQRFDAGVVNKMAVLRAQAQWLNQQRQYADVQSRLLINQVSLWTALGGGFTENAALANHE